MSHAESVEKYKLAEQNAIRALVALSLAEAEMEWINFLEDNNFPMDVEKNEWMKTYIGMTVDQGEFAFNAMDTAMTIAPEEIGK